MSQFTPVYKAFDYKELCRKTSTFEYNTVIDAVNKYGFEGFVQSRTSAVQVFHPKFYERKILLIFQFFYRTVMLTQTARYFCNKIVIHSLLTF